MAHPDKLEHNNGSRKVIMRSNTLEEEEDCALSIPDPARGTWQKIEDDLNQVAQKHPWIKDREAKPATLGKEFRLTVREFTEEFLLKGNEKEDQSNFLQRISFCKYTQTVNEGLLDYATTTSLFKRKDCSNEVTNPLEVASIIKDLIGLIIFLSSDVHCECIFHQSSSDSGGLL